MTRHIRDGKLASYRAGDLGTRESARVRAHLGRCARCSTAAADLAAVSSLLSSVPAPPMPADVTARIEAALAAEAASRAASPAAAARGGQRRETAGREGAARRAAMRNPYSKGWLRSPVTLRVAAGAAVAAVVAGGGFAVFRLAGSTGAANSGVAASGASRSAGSGSAASGAAGSASHEAAPAIVAGPSFSYRAGGRSKPFTVVATSARLGPASLVREVSGQLGSTPGTSTSPAATPGPSAQGGAQRTRSAPGLPAAGFSRGSIEGCVTRVAAGGQVQLVELGRYEGRKAVIIVVSPAGGGPARIWVVGSGCSSARSDVIAQMALPGAG